MSTCLSPPLGTSLLREELVPFLYVQHLVHVFTANTTSPPFSLLFTALGAACFASLLKFKGSRRQVIRAQNFGHVVSWPLLAQEGCWEGEHGKNTAEKKNRRWLSSILTVHRSPPLSELVKTHLLASAPGIPVREVYAGAQKSVLLTSQLILM